MELLQKIEAFLDATGQRSTTFGRDIIGNPSLVAKIRRGLSPAPETVAKIEAYISTQFEAAAADKRECDELLAELLAIVGKPKSRRQIGADLGNRAIIADMEKGGRPHVATRARIRAYLDSHKSGGAE